MNKYESVVIINPTVDEEAMKAIVDNPRELLKSKGIL